MWYDMCYVTMREIEWYSTKVYNQYCVYSNYALIAILFFTERDILTKKELASSLVIFLGIVDLSSKTIGVLMIFVRAYSFRKLYRW